MGDEGRKKGSGGSFFDPSDPSGSRCCRRGMAEFPVDVMDENASVSLKRIKKKFKKIQYIALLQMIKQYLVYFMLIS